MLAESVVCGKHYSGWKSKAFKKKGENGFTKGTPIHADLILYTVRCFEDKTSDCLQVPSHCTMWRLYSKMCPKDYWNSCVKILPFDFSS